MDVNHEIKMVREVFKEIRSQLDNYMEARNFVMSNAQLFTFLSYVPNAMAIASDGMVDEKEMQALESISRMIDVKSMVNMEMMEFLAAAAEPMEMMTNEEFNIRAGGELLFISHNMKNYEDVFTNSVKSLLKFDSDPSREGSLTKSFKSMMDNVIKSNRAVDKESELAKLKVLQQKLGVA